MRGLRGLDAGSFWDVVETSHHGGNNVVEGLLGIKKRTVDLVLLGGLSWDGETRQSFQQLNIWAQLLWNLRSSGVQSGLNDGEWSISVLEIVQFDREHLIRMSNFYPSALKEEERNYLFNASNGTSHFEGISKVDNLVFFALILQPVDDKCSIFRRGSDDV